MFNSIKTIASYYGKGHQELKLLEEIGELKTEILKNLDLGITTDNTPSEVADVLIMIFQIIELYGIRKQVDDQITFKVKRQLFRIQEEILNGKDNE